MKHTKALLALADGTVYRGISLGAEAEAVAEIVFNTAMTGYQEILTDPSYARQMVMLTAAHVGNVGCNAEDNESARIWASGLVLKNACFNPSNYRSSISLPAFLKQAGVPAIANVDTREITLKLRELGAIGACITTDMNVKRALDLARSFPGMQGQDLAKVVSCKTPIRFDEGRPLSWTLGRKPSRFHVVAYDYGVKRSILQILVDLGCRVSLLPAETPAAAALALKPDGILLSNGPGDPAACTYAIEATRNFIAAGIPLLGICLGFQILALACGGRTQKMKFGHHGANHPVLDLGGDKKVFITSQNHGFCVDEASLPSSLEPTHRSLFDGSLQGIRHRSAKAYGFQGHPEASPGPHDIESIFKPFIEAMQEGAVP